MTLSLWLFILLLLACSALHIWRLRETVRELTRENVQLAAAMNREREGRVAAQAESARLAQMVRDGEAAYTRLQENLAVGGWVRLPTDQELEAGQW